LRALIVDSSRTRRSVLRMVLARMGCVQVEDASDAQDALSKVVASKPELILVELDLGAEALGFVRQFRARDGETPVIAITSDAAMSCVIEAGRAGVSACVLRPFTPDELIARIRAAMPRPRKRVVAARSPGGKPAA